MKPGTTNQEFRYNVSREEARNFLWMLNTFFLLWNETKVNLCSTKVYYLESVYLENKTPLNAFLNFDARMINLSRSKFRRIHCSYIVRYRLFGYHDSPWSYRNITKPLQRTYLVRHFIFKRLQNYLLYGNFFALGDWADHLEGLRGADRRLQQQGGGQLQRGDQGEEEGGAGGNSNGNSDESLTCRTFCKPVH